MNSLHIRPMRPDEISIAVDWAAAEGWNPGFADAACFATDDPQGFFIGELDAVALHTPGHTPDSVTYVIGDAVFVGDTLFMPDYGTARADFPGGDARALYRSIRRVL